MQFCDSLTLDAPRRTKDGFLAVRARAARTGVYSYLGSEIDPHNANGLRDAGMVSVLRDETAVFDEKSARSFIGKPITNDHPNVSVTADNWRQHARGTVMGAMRDGEYLAFDLLLTDAEAIRAVDAGKRELSNGYSAELEFGDFTAPDGTKCVARQATIKGNHVALVDAGRAGPECAIKDHAVCDAITADELAQLKATLNSENPMKIITLDGLPVNLGDAAAVEAAIAKLQATIADGAKTLADANTQVSTLTGEKVVLEKQLADLKAELAPAKLDQRVADRAKLVADAKRILPTVVTDAISDADIRRAVVIGKIGDAAKDMDDAAIAGAYIALLTGLEDASPAGSTGVHNLAPSQMKDAAAREREALIQANDHNAWRKQA